MTNERFTQKEIKYYRDRLDQPSEEDVALLEKLCAQAKAYGIPVHIDSADRQRLEQMGGSGRVLKIMGIPVLKGSDLRHIKRYWASEQKKLAEKTAGEQRGK